MYLRIDVLKNFAMFTGKHLRWSLFLINMQAWRPETLLKKDSNIGFFPVKFAKILRGPFFTEHIQWLFLEISLEISLFIAFVNNEWCHFVVRMGSPALISFYCVCFVSLNFFLFFWFFFFFFVDYNAFWFRGKFFNT